MDYIQNTHRKTLSCTFCVCLSYLLVAHPKFLISFLKSLNDYDKLMRIFFTFGRFFVRNSDLEKLFKREENMFATLYFYSKTELLIVTFIGCIPIYTECILKLCFSDLFTHFI